MRLICACCAAILIWLPGGAAADTAVCKPELRPLSVTVDGKEVQVNGMIFGGPASDKTSTSAAVQLEGLLASDLKPAECLQDLVTLAVLAQREGDPAKLLPHTVPELAKLMKESATPEMNKQIKAAMADARAVRLLAIFDAEESIFCIYAVEFAGGAESIQPMSIFSTPAGYLMGETALEKGGKWTGIFKSFLPGGKLDQGSD